MSNHLIKTIRHDVVKTEIRNTLTPRGRHEMVPTDHRYNTLACGHVVKRVMNVAVRKRMRCVECEKIAERKEAA